MRGLGDPDVFLGQDLGIKKAIRAWGQPVSSAMWKPWRSYATFHLWSTTANSHHPSRESGERHEHRLPIPRDIAGD
jgi:AraC family transcriptional regulator, regulatory protein of adaptative response / DNA-3-methyladenine glycosylase II